MIQTLQNDYWRLCIQPAMGVEWLAAQVQRQGQWIDIVPDCRNGQSSLNQANFHMLPYSNRIRDGRFEFQGRTMELENAEHHAIHGALRKLPWEVIVASELEIHCEYNSLHKPAINWPWPLYASIRYELDGRQLLSRIELTNLGSDPMPSGGGWHPYFEHVIQGENAKVQLAVDGIFPDEAGDCLPDGAPVELPETHNFTQLRELMPEQRIDCCLSGFAGEARIQWTKADIELVMTASDNCRYLVFFNPDAPHFAIEPVTNANDAFNLESRGINAGVQVLNPNETLSMEMGIELRDVRT